MEKFLSEFEHQSFEDWLKEAQFALGDKPINKLYSFTYEGIKINPIYTKKDVKNLRYLLSEFPGLPNFVRGSKVSGYKTKPWKTAQSFNGENAKEYNYLLRQGIEIGLDTIVIEVYKNKPNFQCNFFNTLDGFVSSFKDIDVKKFDFFIRTDFFPLTAFYFKEFTNYLKYNSKALYGGFEFNPYKFCLVKGKLPPKNVIESKILNFFDWTHKNFPNFFSICIDSSYFKESGGNAIHEIAFAMSLLVEYLKLFAKSNYELVEITKKFYFKFSFGGEFLTDLAKIRAFRLLLTLILSQFSTELQNYKPIIFAVTTQKNKSSLDPYTNILRNTTETLSGILSSVDYIETIPFNGPLSKVDEFGYRNSQNIQNVLLEEHNLVDTIDPIGGSWFIESFAFQLAKLSLELFKELEKLGGFYEAVKNNIVQSKINENLSKRLMNLAYRKEILVGVNKYPQPIEFAGKYFVTNEAQGSSQNIKNNVELLHLNGHEIFQKEDEIIERARKGDDLFAIELIENFDYFSILQLKEISETNSFESLFKRSNQFKDQFAHRPCALLLNYGNIEDYRARSDFANDFLGVGGFEIKHSKPSFQIEVLAKSFFDSNCEIAVICSSDKLNPQFVPRITTLLKKHKPLSIIILTGEPSSQDLENIYKTSGVDIFIDKGSNVLEELEKIYKLLLI